MSEDRVLRAIEVVVYHAKKTSDGVGKAHEAFKESWRTDGRPEHEQADDEAELEQTDDEPTTEP